MSPRSSVTVGSLLSDQGRHVGWYGSSERWLREVGRVGQVRRSVRRSRPRPRWPARPGACGSRRVDRATRPRRLAPASRGCRGSPRRGGRRRFAAARFVWARRAVVVAAASTLGERAVGPRQGLLDVRFGVAHQLVEQRQGVARQIVSPTAAVRSTVRQGGDRRADEAALPAASGRRRAARAPPSDRSRPRSRAAYGCARVSTVIQSPASRAARRRSCQVRSVSPASVRSRRSKANQRASSSGSRSRRSATNSSGVARSSPWRRSEAALDRLEQRPSGRRGAGRCPGATRRWPSRYSGSASPARPVTERRGEARPDRWSSSASDVPSASAPVAVAGDERRGVGRSSR